MFVIQYKNATPHNAWYMKIVNSVAVLGRSWSCDFMDGDVHKFLTEYEAEQFILLNATTSHTYIHTISICEIDFTAGRIINTTDIIVNGVFVNSAVPIATSTTTQTVANDDDIDYDIPGEALKAHKQGKKVDWKRLAEKY